MKVLEVCIEEENGQRKCVVNASPFDFGQEDVVGVLLGVLYTFSSCVEEKEEEDFIHSVLERFAEDVLEGRLHAESEVIRNE